MRQSTEVAVGKGEQQKVTNEETNKKQNSIIRFLAVIKIKLSTYFNDNEWMNGFMAGENFGFIQRADI